MRDIVIPPGSREIEDFAFVKVVNGASWRPALLERWFHLPDGTWACRLRMAGHRAPRGRVTHVMTVAYNPAVIQKITGGGLNAEQRPSRT